MDYTVRIVPYFEGNGNVQACMIAAKAKKKDRGATIDKSMFGLRRLVSEIEIAAAQIII